MTAGVILYRVCIYSILTIASIAALSKLATAAEKFQTQESLEPDIWASVWLIAKVEGGSTLVEANPKSRNKYVSFGFEGAEIFLPGKSHFKHLLSRFEVDDTALAELGELVASVERLGWQSQSNRAVTDFEYRFRAMQEQFGRYWVPLGCYKDFFDFEYAKLANEPFTSSGSDCQHSRFQTEVSRATIPTTAIEHVLYEIEQGKNVVFVDTREPSEFEERHIPGAISVPFRDLGSIDASVIANADMVVPYCIKDFRGFEAARRLSENGANNVTLLDPFGLAGWVERQLPLVGSMALSEAEGQAQLNQCIQSRCLSVDSESL